MRQGFNSPISRWVRIALALLIAAPWCAGAQGIDANAARRALDRMLDDAARVIEGVESHAPPPAAAPDETAAIVLTASEAVRRALRDNAQALAAAESVVEAEARIDQARSARHPQVAARTNFAYIEGLQTNLSTGGFLAGSTLDRELGAAKKWLASADVSVQQILYAGGRIKAAIAAAGHLADAEEWQRAVRLDELAYQTRQAFHDLLLAHALREVAREAAAVFARHRQDAEKLLDAGLVSRFEVLRAETETGARRSDEAAAATVVDLARMNLLRLMAMPMDSAVAPDGVLEWIPLDDPVETLIDKAFEQRAELKALDAGRAAARQEVIARRGQYRPTATAAVAWQEIEGGPPLAPDGLVVSVGAEWELYAGGRRRAEIAEAEARARNLDHQRAELLQLVELDVRQAHARVHEAIEKIRAEKGMVALAEEGLRLAELRFAEGAGTQSETMNAALALTQARTALLQALRDYAVAIAALDKATGGRGLESEAG